MASEIADFPVHHAIAGPGVEADFCAVWGATLRLARFCTGAGKVDCAVLLDLLGQPGAELHFLACGASSKLIIISMRYITFSTLSSE